MQAETFRFSKVLVGVFFVLGIFPHHASGATIEAAEGLGSSCTEALGAKSFHSSDSCIRDPQLCRSEIARLKKNRPVSTFREFQRALHPGLTNADRPLAKALFQLMPQTTEEKEFRLQVFKDLVLRAAESMKKKPRKKLEEWVRQGIEVQSLEEMPDKENLQFIHGTNKGVFERIQSGQRLKASGGDLVGVTFAVFAADNEELSSRFMQWKSYKQGAEEGALLDLKLDPATRVLKIDSVAYHILIEELIENDAVFNLFSRVFPSIEGFQGRINKQFIAYFLGADVIYHQASYPGFGGRGVDRLFEYAIINPYVLESISLR